MTKKYAPLVSQEKYVYEKDEDPFFRESIRSIPDTYRRYMSVVYCPKCGHMHLVDGRRYRYQNYLRKFLCPECGYKNMVSQTGCWENPETAMIFKMADGSIAVSLIIRRHTLLLAKDLKTPIYSERLMRVRYVFNANGHTYYKNPVYIDTNREVKTYAKPQASIRPVTYINYGMDWGALSSFPYFGSDMRKLVQHGYLPEDCIRRNRFRKVSNKMLDDIYSLLSMFHRQQTDFGRRVARVIREIDKDATDEDVIRLLIKRANMKNGGKKFRRSMVANPVQTFVGSLVFNKLKITDINYFDIIKHVSPSLLSNESCITLIEIIRKKYGEKALVKALQNATIFRDSFYYLKDLLNTIPASEVEKLIRYNIRDTHDALLATYKEIREQTECGRGVAAVMQKHNEIESGKIKPQYVSAAKTLLIHHAEETINNQIAYGDQEKELEENINNIQFYLPPDTDHLKMAGDKLHNCVGHLYRMAAYRKKSIIVLMKQLNKFVGCIEINEGKIKQAYGPCNQRFNQDAQKAFNRWTAKHNLSETDTNTDFANVEKEYVMPKYEDVIEKIKTLAANITIPAVQTNFRIAAPF